MSIEMTDEELRMANRAFREKDDEIERLRRQRDELHAANNRLLDERRTAELVMFLIAKAQWSLATFGPGMRTEGICRHIEKELVEIRAKPFDLVEWVDVAFLAMDGFWRACWGIRDGQQPNRAMLEQMAYDFIRVANDKHAENLQRQWPVPTGEDQPVEHIRCDQHPLVKLHL
jgi:Protein of unknown function (DUF550)